MGLLLRRCRARTALFAAVLHPYAGAPEVLAVTWWHAPDGRALACRLDADSDRELWMVRLRPDAATAQPGDAGPWTDAEAYRQAARQALGASPDGPVWWLEV
jgi:hypothetical protein